jgi:uncharacterized protein (DUF1800 family)
MSAGALTRSEVARILGRVAFGATAADLDRWTGKPQADLAAHLLNIPSTSELASLQADEVERLSLTGAGTSASKENGRTQHQAAQGWWLERMRNAPWPLLERMTLFWHDHFATGPGSPFPDVAMLMGQNQTLRTLALGDFSELVAAMTVDPAMLHWLDGARNVTGKPNENYARELFELFTLGVSPQQFTEDDIREAARALTGWTVNGQRQAAFDARRHDTQDKIVLGRRIGNLGASEHLAVRDAALALPSAAGFVAWKLVQRLAYDPGPMDVTRPSDPLVDQVAAALRPSWNIRAAVEVILRSPKMLDPNRQLARHPAEQAVHACKALGVPADTNEALASLEAMGQRLFDPPNVGGWPVDEEWISPGTTLARYRLATHLEAAARGALGNQYLTALPASNDLDGWAARFGLGGFTPNTRETLTGYLRSTPTATPESQRRKGVMTLILSSPDWTVL